MAAAASLLDFQLQSDILVEMLTFDHFGAELEGEGARGGGFQRHPVDDILGGECEFVEAAEGVK